MHLMKVHGIVYLLRNRVNNKIYIGQTIQNWSKRWKGHLDSSKGKEPMIVSQAIAKHGSEQFEMSILCSAADQESLNIIEDFYISKCQSFQKGIGYNRRRGGGNGSFSEESRKKMSASRTGVVMKESTKQKIAEANTGKKWPAIMHQYNIGFQKGHKFANYPRSEETKRRMSGRIKYPEEIEKLREAAIKRGFGLDCEGEKNPFFGKKHTEETLEKLRNRVVSDETKKRISNSKMGENGSKFRHDIKTEDLVKMYESGLSTNAIGKIFNFDGSSVYLRLKKEGVTFR